MGFLEIALIALAVLGQLSHAEECSELGVILDVTDSVQILTSPGYGVTSRPTETRCLWIFNAPKDKFIEFTFTEVSLLKHHTCISEYVQIEYEGSVEPHLRYCSDIVPEKVVISAQATPSVSFITGYSKDKNLRGFRLEYKLLDQEQKCESGFFSCKQPFKCISSAQVCDGRSDCEDGKDEENCGHKVAEPSECGISKIPQDLDRIVGGQTAVPGSWPWMASLQANYIFPSGHSCGAALLNNLYVVTAAHCIVGRFFKAFRVRFGDHHQFQKDEGEISRSLAMYYMHPNYNRMDSSNDIAVLKLAAPVEYTKTISPICLPKKDDFLTDGTLLHASGWGETLEIDQADELRQVETPIINTEKCRSMVSRKLPDRTLCSGFEDGGKNPCFGDSGGPLMMKSDGRWILQGVVSWGPLVCGEAGQATVYSQIAAHVDWIQSVIKQAEE